MWLFHACFVFGLYVFHARFGFGGCVVAFVGVVVAVVLFPVCCGCRGACDEAIVTANAHFLCNGAAGLFQSRNPRARAQQ